MREAGGGRWEKAISIDTTTDKAKKTLEEVGWRHDLGPVWVVVEPKA